MSRAWGQIILATVFMLTVVALRIRAARKYAKVRKRIENTDLQEAYDAMSASGNTSFIFLIMTLVWIANEAWSKI